MLVLREKLIQTYVAKLVRVNTYYFLLHRLLMIVFGIIPMMVSRALLFPMSSDPIPINSSPFGPGSLGPFLALCESEGWDTTDVSEFLTKLRDVLSKKV